MTTDAAITATQTPLVGLIPLLPLGGAAISGALALAKAKSPEGACKRTSAIASCLAPVAAFFVTAYLFLQMWQGGVGAFETHWFTWIPVGNLQIGADLHFDALSAVMCLVITFIGSLIHLYSVGYMQRDPSFARYFSYLNLFTFSMLILVLGKNLPVMFVGWEGVGLCSYLLIGFWFGEKAYTTAGNKAFIVNRVGDFGFLLGIFLLFGGLMLLHPDAAITLGMGEVNQAAAKLHPWLVTAAALLLFVGATGKSAQIPLHVWLPDAMAGPTPVSALIHAATMVTAGVYMIARLHGLFDEAPLAQLVIVSVGTLTALVAATIAVTQNDIKKVLAYSTVSQLGYMFMAVGVGAYAAGVFHLFTHAFFKALLFLGAGAVIHAYASEDNHWHGEQDLWKMGGLRNKLKTTHAVFLVGTLAIAGVPPLAGFFSKDEILWSVWSAGYPWYWLVGLATAMLTAYYMTRLYMLAFAGRPRDQHLYEHAHEAPAIMAWPLILLAAGSAVVGFLGAPWKNSFAEWLGPAIGGYHHHELPQSAYVLMAASVAVALAGIFWAVKQYGGSPAQESPAQKGALYRAAANKWGFDDLYDALFVRPAVKGSKVVLEEGVEKTGLEAVVQGLPMAYWGFSNTLRAVQTGFVKTYAWFLLAGTLAFSVYYLLKLELIRL